MEAFVDGFMDAQMKSGPVAGAAVIVVKDGQVFFQKGYGYEDVEKQVPVDPAQTLFRPGLGVEAVHLDVDHAAGRGRASSISMPTSTST